MDDEGDLKEGLCLQCFLERNPVIVLPDVLDLVHCPTCGSAKGRGGWRDAPGGEPGAGGHEFLQRSVFDAVEEALSVVEGGRVRSLDMDGRPEGRSAYVVDVLAEVDLMGEVVHGDAVTRVRLRGELCPVCSRLAGNYYEAVVQFRGDRERPATEDDLRRARAFVVEEVERMSAASRDVALVKVERIHGGLDFYMTTQAAGAQIARGLSSLFSADTSSTTSTVGRRDGRELVRVTHLVRLPDLRQGDLVLLEEVLYKVASATSRNALLDPAAGSGRRRKVSRDQRRSLTFGGEASSVEEAVLVSSSGGEVQVLDPETLRTVELELPEGFDPSGRETVLVLRIDDRLYLVDG